VKLLTGMYQPTSGQVLLDGVTLADLDVAAWRERTAAAFQDFVRYEFLAGETMGIGDLPRFPRSARRCGAPTPPGSRTHCPTALPHRWAGPSPEGRTSLAASGNDWPWPAA